MIVFVLLLMVVAIALSVKLIELLREYKREADMDETPERESATKETAKKDSSSIRVHADMKTASKPATSAMETEELLVWDSEDRHIRVCAHCGAENSREATECIVCAEEISPA